MMPLFLNLLVASFLAIGAPHSGSRQQQDILQLLKQPHQKAASLVSPADASSAERLRTLAFDPKQPMEARWKAFMVLTSVRGKKALPSIKKALMSSTWFMRSAGLAAIEKMDHQSAKRWALQKLSSDPALMVRVKALQILKGSSDPKVIKVFWRKMYDKDSFHRRQSLWIRQELAKSLALKPRSADLRRWTRLLHGSDVRVKEIAGSVVRKLSQDPSAKTATMGQLQKKYPQSTSQL